MVNIQMVHIPFNRPQLHGNELEYVRQAFSNAHISGDGVFTKRCQELLQTSLGIPKVLLTTSCTHALELSAFLLDIQPGDEVIVPSFTFVSSINAFVIRGAKPVFADIRPDTLNLDPSCLERLFSPRTRALVIVHYGGVGCEMNEIMNATFLRNIPVVEDNAHGLFGTYREKYLGTFGPLGTLSFHETKNFSCGEGGALLINDPKYFDRAEILREKGTNRSRFFRGQVDKYTWLDVGSSYLPSDVLAAVLWAQLERREQIQSTRKYIWDYYYEHLGQWAEKNGVVLPKIPCHCGQAFHLFHLLLPDLSSRQAFLKHLRGCGIFAVFHYLPLHLSDMGRRFGGKEGDCPVAECISNRIVRLPFFVDITEHELEEVVGKIQLFRV